MKILTSATKITLLILVLSLVIFTGLQIPVDEPFKTVVLMVISFYFGQKINQNEINTA